MIVACVSIGSLPGENDSTSMSSPVTDVDCSNRTDAVAR